jgi:hypothetical protein
MHVQGPDAFFKQKRLQQLIAREMPTKVVAPGLAVQKLHAVAGKDHRLSFPAQSDLGTLFDSV